jgi:hypothetical protein
MSESQDSLFALPPRLSSEPRDNDEGRDQWTDAPESFDGHHTHDRIDEQDPLSQSNDHLDLQFGPPKLSKSPTPPAIDTSVGPSPTSDSLTHRPYADTNASASTHSLPTVHVTPESDSALSPQPQSAHSAAFPQASLENARSQLRASVAVGATATTHGSNPPPSPSRRSLAAAPRLTEAVRCRLR